MENNNDSTILDMLSNYSDQNAVSVDEIFKKKPGAEPPIQTKPASGWVPDAEDIAGMDELNKSSGVMYKRDEWKDTMEVPGTVNILDDHAEESGADAADEMKRVSAHIEASKKRLGIKHLNLPTLYRAKIISAASYTSGKEHDDNLDSALKQLIEKFPEAVVETYPGYEPIAPTMQVIRKEVVGPNNAELDEKSEEPVHQTQLSEHIVDEVVIHINKDQAPALVFDDDELNKIKRSRSVTVDIVEGAELKYHVVKSDDDDDVVPIERVMAPYIRKTNDTRASLPASRYRATFTGLTYLELVDLQMSHDLNGIDHEWKKWSIAYKHTTGASIGEFEDFEDFLKKTAALDLEFILFQIVNATCMEKEIITIDCKVNKCPNTYEWAYSPASLIDMESVPVNTLEEMKVTGEANGDEIISNYRASMLYHTGAFTLPNSKCFVVFGHTSAYDHLTKRLADIEAHRTSESEQEDFSDKIAEQLLHAIKSVKIPTSNGNIAEVTSYSKGSNIIRFAKSLDETDFKVLLELADMIASPYMFTFRMLNLVCPRCGARSSMNIDDMSRLLFIAARSLMAGKVTLKR